MPGDFVEYDLGHQAAGVGIEVTLEHRANVLLMDGPNFQRYRDEGEFSYSGGEARHSPVILEVPSAGHWHVVVDLGGAEGEIKASVRVLE
jgi:hypothetical protein